MMQQRGYLQNVIAGMVFVGLINLLVATEKDAYAAMASATAPASASPQFKQAESALALAPVRSNSGNNGGAQTFSADGVVEAIRQSQIAPQVAGAIVELPVKVGDSVKAGALLARLDARAANQEVAASRAQVDAARAALVVAAKDFERQKQLFAKDFISAAQLERSESQFKSASAQANAQIAQAGAVQTQSGFYVLTAPYAAVVAERPANLGDMAVPGHALMTVYDPSALRVTATMSQTRLAGMVAGQSIRIEFPSLPEAQRWLTVSKFSVLPVIDAATHSAQLRVDLPSDIKGLTPGMFARVSLVSNIASKSNTIDIARGNASSVRLYVPAKAVFRRAELTAVYVMNAQGKPLLRQVRAGAILDKEQEILSGLSAGEQVVLDPVAAAKASMSGNAK